MKPLRSRVLIICFLILAAIIIGRLCDIQIINRKFYLAQALGQQSAFQEVTGDRGEIFFESSKESRGAYGTGQVKSLAINRETWTAYAIASAVKDKDHFASVASTAIGEPKQFILSKLNDSPSYAILKNNIPGDQVQALKDLKLEGLFFESAPARYYPQGQLASQVVGFLGGDGQGQYGIEGYYDDLLKGKEGIKEASVGLSSIGSQDTRGSLNGSDIFLTLDYNIQFEAESLLIQAKKDINIDSGQIIVMKPDSGRILALAGTPLFDPNIYSKETNFDIFQNAAVQKIFEPGSVFKPFTMAMALNEGKVTPETSFVDNGFVKIGPDTIYNFNHEKYGLRDMSGILEKSINTGAVFLSQMIPHNTFLSYLDLFGFSKKTDIELQGEVASRNELLRKGSDFGFATSSFGQGIEMTPMQLISAFSAFANEGKVASPYIVEKMVSGNQETVTRQKISTPVISAKTASMVATMLTNVVERGFGDGAKIKGYYLAGKTGTAEVPFKDKKGYYPDRTIQSFIGFGPAQNPQFLVLVKLDHPNVPRSALSAVPIFKKMAQYLITYWQIPPDYK